MPRYTFVEAQKVILSHLVNNGWQVNSLLKVPTATRHFPGLPTGVTLVLLFKPQSIHAEIRRRGHKPRSLSLHADPRQIARDYEDGAVMSREIIKESLVIAGIILDWDKGVLTRYSDFKADESDDNEVS